MKSLLAVSIAALSLIACGNQPEEKQGFKLSGDGEEYVQQQTEQAPVEQPMVSGASVEADEGLETEESIDGGTGNAVSIQSEPRTPEQQRLDEMGVDYYLIVDGRRFTLYVREMDVSLAQAAIADLQINSEWVLALRPNNEILTANGFTVPPPSVESILAGRGITNYMIEGTTITVDADGMGNAALATTILGVFYPGVEWTFVLFPEPEDPEEPGQQPEEPETEE